MLGGSSASGVDRRVDVVLARRGGDAQRATARARLGLVHESEVGELLYFFMWGLIPATMVQRIASAMQADMRALGVESDPRIAHLASLGSDGKYQNNIRSQLIASFKSLVGVVQPCWIRVPSITTSKLLTLVPTWIDHPIIMMNELFDAVYHHFPAYFTKFLGGGLERFWDKVAIIQWVLI